MSSDQSLLEKTGSKGWTAAENVAYFKAMTKKQISEDSPETEQIWKDLGKDVSRPEFPTRAPSAIRQHVKDVISNVRSMTCSFSKSEPDKRCPSFEEFSSSLALRY